MLKIFNEVTNFKDDEFISEIEEKKPIMDSEDLENRCDTKCNLVSKFVLEMNKQKKFKEEVNKLPKQKIGILFFNTSEATDTIATKIDY